VRAALKSISRFSSSPKPDASALSPSSAYLRLLLPGSGSPPTSPPTIAQWLAPETAVSLLEWRAALVVKELAKNVKEPDASVYQRVSKAVTEAFVGRQVGDTIASLGQALGAKEGEVVKKLLTLVRLIVLRLHIEF